jgi:quinol monooxygenase YgiN
MSVSLLAALAGIVLALASLIVLVMRCSRAPRLVMLAWTGAVFGVALSLAAQAAGFAAGFSSLTFRVSQIGLVAVGGLALVLGLGEAAGRSGPARFAVRLAVSGLGVVSVVILATDPLSEEPFGKTFPAAAVHYQPISNALLSYALGPFIAVAALVAVACTAVRARKDPAWRATLPAVAGGSVAALAAAAPALSKLLSDRLGLNLTLTAAYPFLCIVAVGVTWWSVVKVSGLRLEVVHEGVDFPREDTGEWERPRSWGGGPGTGEFDPYTDGGGYPPSGLPAYQPGLPSPALPPPGLPQPAFAGAGPGQPPGGGIMPGGPPMPAADDPAAWARLVGQIVIFTLLDGSVPAFDAMIGSVTEQVRAGEPGTLVFIVHAVPSAPQQRILYEVYRDRDAYQAHQQQPYLMRFEQDRREHVLATNVIELSLQPAKVSQLPALGQPGPAGGPPLPALSQPLSGLPPMGALPSTPSGRVPAPSAGSAPPPASLPHAGMPAAGLSVPGLSVPGRPAPGLTPGGRPGPGLAPAASMPPAPASANGGSGHGRPPAGLPPHGSLTSLPALGAPLPPGGAFPPASPPYADGPSPGGSPPPGPPSGYGPPPGGPGRSGPQDPYAAPPRASGQHPYDGPPPYNGGPPPYDDGQPRRDGPPYPNGRPYQGDRNGGPPRRDGQDGGYDGSYGSDYQHGDYQHGDYQHGDYQHGDHPHGGYQNGGHQDGSYQNGSGRP